MTVSLLHGDAREKLRELPDNSIDSIVTDPPYELGFMGKGWDKSGVASNPEVWRECLRILKPGGYLLAFGGSRTYHRLASAVEDAGFEIRDQIMWLYGSGFPKSLDVSKAIDKAAGAEREVIITAPATDAAKQWQGWGTALKPAHEPIVVARKPLIGTVAQNVLEHGTGALNIDSSRVPTTDGEVTGRPMYESKGWKNTSGMTGSTTDAWKKGRWPANLIHDGSEEVLDEFAKYGERKACMSPSAAVSLSSIFGGKRTQGNLPMDHGTAARFFYCAKANKKDRGDGNIHPTVKPTSLMQYLVKLVTPPGGTVLDPFTGSGSTGKAAIAEGFSFVGIETDEEYLQIAKKRLEGAHALEVTTTQG